nr:rRNA 2'-O-methyltransferase fibrillarin-like [Aegilops tauschii subsp. strangulata]
MRLVRRIRGGAGGTGAGHGKLRPVAANGGRARRRQLAREQPGGEGGHRQARQCARVRAGETGRGGATMGAFRGAGARVRTACEATAGGRLWAHAGGGGWGCGSASSRAATGARQRRGPRGGAREGEEGRGGRGLTGGVGTGQRGSWWGSGPTRRRGGGEATPGDDDPGGGGEVYAMYFCDLFGD